MKISWLKIIGVTGTAFFTTLGGLLTVDTLANEIIPSGLLIPSALIVAGIQGGLAFFREITTECDTPKPDTQGKKKGSMTCSINKFLNHILLA